MAGKGSQKPEQQEPRQDSDATSVNHEKLCILRTLCADVKRKEVMPIAD